MVAEKGILSTNNTPKIASVSLLKVDRLFSSSSAVVQVGMLNGCLIHNVKHVYTQTDFDKLLRSFYCLVTENRWQKINIMIYSHSINSLYLVY